MNRGVLLFAEFMKNILVVFLSFLSFFSFAFADEITADKVFVSTPQYSPELTDFKPALGKYEYSVTWAGIPAATVTLEVLKERYNYKVTTNVKSSRGVSLFYKLKYNAEGLISAINFRPLNAKIDLNENSKIKKAIITYSNDGFVKSHYQVNDREPIEMNFDPKNNMLDPFSAAFIARSLNWEPKVTRYFDTFNGKTRYLISFTAVDKIKMEINNQRRDVWVIEPAVKKLTTTKNEQKLRKAKIYVTADEAREIIKINSEVFIGSVNTKLVSFMPSQVDQTSTIALNKKIEYNF